MLRRLYVAGMALALVAVLLTESYGLLRAMRTSTDDTTDASTQISVYISYGVVDWPEGWAGAEFSGNVEMGDYEVVGNTATTITLRLNNGRYACVITAAKSEAACQIQVNEVGFDSLHDWLNGLAPGIEVKASINP